MVSIAYTFPWWVTGLFALYMLYAATAGAADLNLNAPWGYRPKLILAEVAVLIVVGFICPKVNFAALGPLNFGGKTVSFIQFAIAYAIVGIPLACVSWGVSRAFFAKKSDIDDMNKYA